MVVMDVLSSRFLLHPSDPERSRRFYRDTLGLAIYREFGPSEDPGLVFFLGGGFLELSRKGAGQPIQDAALWLQVRDVEHEHVRLLASGVSILRKPRLEAWGLREMWIEDPDGLRLVLVQVPDDHPLRRDQR
jgi:catechol 2,3-dioxygenase-like lactoylglutathione lyase family enzyme